MIERFVRHTRCPRLLGTVFLVGLTVLATHASATNDLCGQTVFEDTKLDHDLTCAGTGVVIGADNVTLDLNGHTIAGSGTTAGSGFGITVVGRTSVSIRNGTVRNFEAGVRVMNSTDVQIKHNDLRENGDGIDFASGSVGNTAKENTFTNNRARGIMLRGGVIDNVIKENSFVGNRVGVLVFGGVDNTITENTVSESTLAGIRINVLAGGNRLVENRVFSNPAGIEFLVMSGSWSIGNTLLENWIALNACGLKGPIAGNAFNDNQFEGNVADTCS